MPPDFDGDEGMPSEMGDSPILAALMGSMGGAGGMGMDPYAVGPMEPPNVFDGAGTGDPSGGMAQLIRLLMLAQAGMGGAGMGPASSGMEPGPSSPGLAQGLGF